MPYSLATKEQSNILKSKLRELSGLNVGCRISTGSMKHFYSIRPPKGQKFTEEQIVKLCTILGDMNGYNILGEKLDVSMYVTNTPRHMINLCYGLNVQFKNQ